MQSVDLSAGPPMAGWYEVKSTIKSESTPEPKSKAHWKALGHAKPGEDDSSGSEDEEDVAPKVPHALTIVIFGFAGGNSWAYDDMLQGLFPPEVKVYSAEYPGHGRKSNVFPYRHMEPLSNMMADTLERKLCDEQAPYVVLGHQMGSAVLLATVRKLEARLKAKKKGAAAQVALAEKMADAKLAGLPDGVAEHLGKKGRDGMVKEAMVDVTRQIRLPSALFVAGRGPPHVEDPGRSMAMLSIAELRQELKSIGSPLANYDASTKEFLIFYNLIRSDACVTDLRVAEAAPQVTMPVYAYRFKDERGGAEHELMSRWAELTAASFSLRTLPGSHMALLDPRSTFRRSFADDVFTVATTLAGPPPDAAELADARAGAKKYGAKLAAAKAAHKEAAAAAEFEKVAAERAHRGYGDGSKKKEADTKAEALKCKERMEQMEKKAKKHGATLSKLEDAMALRAYWAAEEDGRATADLPLARAELRRWLTVPVGPQCTYMSDIAAGGTQRPRVYCLESSGGEGYAQAEVMRTAFSEWCEVVPVRLPQRGTRAAERVAARSAAAAIARGAADHEVHAELAYNGAPNHELSATELAAVFVKLVLHDKDVGVNAAAAAAAGGPPPPPYALLAFGDGAAVALRAAAAASPPCTALVLVSPPEISIGGGGEGEPPAAVGCGITVLAEYGALQSSMTSWAAATSSDDFVASNYTELTQLHALARAISGALGVQG